MSLLNLKLWTHIWSTNINFSPPLHWNFWSVLVWTFNQGDLRGRGSIEPATKNYFVTDGQKRDYLSRASQHARGATKNKTLDFSGLLFSHGAVIAFSNSLLLFSQTTEIVFFLPWVTVDFDLWHCHIDRIGVNFPIKWRERWSPASYGSLGQPPPPLKRKAFILSVSSANEAQICPFLLPCKLFKNMFWKNIVAFLFGVILLCVIYAVIKSGEAQDLESLGV